jgi:hypothetical protein
MHPKKEDGKIDMWEQVKYAYAIFVSKTHEGEGEE